MCLVVEQCNTIFTSILAPNTGDTYYVTVTDGLHGTYSFEIYIAGELLAIPTCSLPVSCYTVTVKSNTLDCQSFEVNIVPKNTEIIC